MHKSILARIVFLSLLGLMGVHIGNVQGQNRILPVQPAQIAPPRPARMNEANDQEEDLGFLDSFSPIPRELQLLLKEAREDIDAENYHRAIERLSAILNGEAARLLQLEEDQDYFIRSQQNSGTSPSLKSEARRLLGLLPEQGLEIYELHQGMDARLALDAAITNGNLESLMEVTRRYFHTEAGYDAMFLLGYRYLSESQPLAAANCFGRLAGSPAAARFDPQLTVLWAISLHFGGMSDKAIELFTTLERRTPSTMIQIGANDIRLPSDENLSLAWLETHLGAPHYGDVATNKGWAQFRGNPSRTAHAEGSFPLPTRRWSNPLTNRLLDQNHISAQHREYVSQRIPALPVIQPLAIGYHDQEGNAKNVVIMRSTDQLLGIDFETGKKIWEFSFPRAGIGTELSANAEENESRNTQLHRRIWDDSSYGQFSSNGEFVFLIQRPDLSQYNTPVSGSYRDDFNYVREDNILFALDLSTDASQVWIQGGMESEALEEAIFLGAPLPLGDQLYLIVEINKVIELVSLDARTGAIIWSQQLSILDYETNVANSLRWEAGVSPSYADGILVCPTASGAIVAIDITTRDLLWGYQYSQEPIDRRVLSLQRAGRIQLNPKPLGKRWSDATCMLAEGKVLMTPVDSDQLICLDLYSGNEIWKHDSRNNMLHVAGVFEGKVILVGSTEVRALSLETGEDCWAQQREIPNDALVSGRGFISEGSLFLPTTFPELLQINLQDGSILEQSPTETILGNLICYQNDVISLGVDSIQAFHQEAPLRETVAERLEADPHDAEALKLLSDLQLHEGHFQEALVSLRRAYEIASEDETIQTALIELVFKGLREDYAANAGLADAITPLITEDDQQEFLQLMASGEDEAGNIQQAFSYYLQILSLSRSPVLANSDILPAIDQQRNVDHDCWVEARIASLFERADREQRESMTQRAQGMLGSAIANEEVASFEKMVSILSWHPQISGTQLALAERFLARGQRLEAEQIWLDLRQQEGEEAAVALAHLASLWTEKGNALEAAALYRELESEWPSTICLNGKTGAQLAEAARQNESLNLYLGDHNTWKSGAATINSSQSSLNNNNNLLLPITIQREDQGQPNVEIFLDQHFNSLVIRNSSGEHSATLPLSQAGSSDRTYFSNSIMNHGIMRGHLVLISMGSEVMAIDLLGDKETPDPHILWRHHLMTPSSGEVMRIQPKVIHNPWTGQQFHTINHLGEPVGLLGPLDSKRFFFQKGSELRCIDPLTGKSLWTRNDVIKGSDLLGDADFLLTIAPGTTTARVFRVADGEELDSCTVPRETLRWTSIGRRILTWDQQPTQMTLRLFDPIEGDNSWSYHYAIGSKGYLLENHYLGVMQPDGQFDLITLDDGSKKIQTMLEPEDNLGQIFMHASPDQFFLVTNNPMHRAEAHRSIQAAPGGQHTHMINGRLYAFHNQTGEASWPAPATINRYGFPLDQPTQSPALLFMRNITTANPGGQRIMSTSALLIDHRDGRLLAKVDQENCRTIRYEMIARPEAQEIELRLPQRTTTITLTDNPRPPEPPLQAKD